MLAGPGWERAFDQAEHEQQVEVGPDEVGDRGHQDPAGQAGGLPKRAGQFGVEYVAKACESWEALLLVEGPERQQDLAHCRMGGLLGEQAGFAGVVEPGMPPPDL